LKILAGVLKMKRTIRIKTTPKERALNVLKTITDPEIGANILDIGLIYDLKVENNSVKILMTLTSIACPYGNYVVTEVENKLKEAGFKNVEVKLTFDPPWTPERMSKELRKRLGI
jgi:metal-sulfur cluster biosynthetic enzyme